jgi:hypothetical protein
VPAEAAPTSSAISTIAARIFSYPYKDGTVAIKFPQITRRRPEMAATELKILTPR